MSRRSRERQAFYADNDYEIATILVTADPGRIRAAVNDGYEPGMGLATNAEIEKWRRTIFLFFTAFLVPTAIIGFFFLFFAIPWGMAMGHTGTNKYTMLIVAVAILAIFLTALIGSMTYFTIHLTRIFRVRWGYIKRLVGDGVLTPNRLAWPRFLQMCQFNEMSIDDLRGMFGADVRRINYPSAIQTIAIFHDKLVAYANAQPGLPESTPDAA